MPEWAETGWYIDDIILKTEAGVYNSAALFNENNQIQSSSDANTFITANLPLTWSSFTAFKEDKNALLNWSTFREQNTSNFIIERSADGVTFEQLGSVKAAGNSSYVRNYSLTDKSPHDGINYYRIKQVDTDGHFSYSQIRPLTFINTKGDITISPNPVKDKIHIVFPGNNQKLNIVIYTAKGEKAGSYIMTGETLRLNLSHYSSGIYNVMMSREKMLVTKKLVIE